MTGTRICNQCAKRRKAMEARKALLKNRGKKVQAATLGAVLAVTETVGNVFGITGEEGEHERERREDQASGERSSASID